MAEFKYIVIVECESAAQAEQVMTERIGFDEDYGFDYRIRHSFDSRILQGGEAEAENERAYLRAQERKSAL